MSNEPIEGVGFNEFVEAVIRLSREPNALQEVVVSLGLAGPERWSAVERAWRARIDGDPMLKQVYEMFTEQAGVGSVPNTTSSPGPSPSEPSTAMVAPGPPPPAPQAAQPAPLFVPSYMLNAQAPAPPSSPAPSPAPPPSSPVAPMHAVAFEASRAVEAKFTMPASSLAAPVSLPFRDKPEAPLSGIQIRHASPAPISAEQSGFTAAPNSKALNAPALPFPGRAPDAEEIPLARYAEITSLLLREGNPEATFARMGVDAGRWMKIVQSFSVRFEQDPNLKARFDALVGSPVLMPAHPPVGIPQNKGMFAGTLPPSSNQPRSTLPFNRGPMPSPATPASEQRKLEVRETVAVDPGAVRDAGAGLPPFPSRATPAEPAKPPSSPNPRTPPPTQDIVLPPLGRLVQIQAALAAAPDRARTLAEAGYSAEAWQAILRRYGEMMRHDPVLRNRYEALLLQVRGGG